MRVLGTCAQGGHAAVPQGEHGGHVLGTWHMHWSSSVQASVGGYFSVPARTQIWWDLIPTDIDGDPQSVGPGLVDPRDLGG